MHRSFALTLRRTLALVLAACGLAAVVACSGGSAGPPAAQAGGGAAPAAGAEPVAPMSSRGMPVGEAPGAGAATGTIAWDLPAGWQGEPPSSGMRLAQALIPGDGGPGQLVVFYFGAGGGGGVDANLERWEAQMEGAPGVAPVRSTFETHGYRVTMVEVAGTLKPSGMGMGPDTPQANSRLLAAVVEGPGGPWFFKATGPDATMAAGRDAFRAMLESVRSST